jgi:hypothetical protein
MENAKRVLAAVRAFGFPALELDAEAMIDPRGILQMGVEPVQIHVMSAISGVTWDEAWLSRAPGRCGSHVVAFLGREAFLKNKRASARPKDLWNRHLRDGNRRPAGRRGTCVSGGSATAAEPARARRACGPSAGARADYRSRSIA